MIETFENVYFFLNWILKVSNLNKDILEIKFKQNLNKEICKLELFFPRKINQQQITKLNK